MQIVIAGLLLAVMFPASAAAQGLSSLPDYRPDQQVSGVLRSRGNDQMTALMKRWENGFRKYQPGIQFADTLKGSASGMYGLEMRTADIAVMGRPINPYERYGSYERSITYFQSKVVDGGALWNEDLREYEDRKQMIADLSRDPYGIAYTALGYRTAGVKPVALADTSAGPFVELSRKSVTDRSYPLSRPVYLVYTIDNEKSEIADPRVDPKVREFLRYILSRQGQQDVVRDGAYLPLPFATVKEQLKKLDSKDPPRELELLEE